jgi:hypothetical protein
MEKLGYHKNCGGIVRFHNNQGRIYQRCSRCMNLSPDIESNQLPIPRRNSKGMVTAGIKKRIKKYDYEKWEDVK